jgi:hypothetical protein
MSVLADGRYLAAATSSGRTYIWALATNSLGKVTGIFVKTLPDPASARTSGLAVAFSWDSSQLTVGDSNGITYVYDILKIGA